MADAALKMPQPEFGMLSLRVLARLLDYPTEALQGPSVSSSKSSTRSAACRRRCAAT